MMQYLEPVGSHDTYPFAAVSKKPLLQQALFVSTATNGDQEALEQWADSLTDEQRQRFMDELQAAIASIVELWTNVARQVNAAMSSAAREMATAFSGVDTSKFAEFVIPVEEPHDR